MDWTALALTLGALAISVAVHESAHAWTAWKLGDPTGMAMGRVTLNPIPHIDLFGTIVLPLALWIGSRGAFTFGYAKPVPYNPYALKNPPLGSAAIAAAGPVSNVLLALVGALALRGLSVNEAFMTSLGWQFLTEFVFLNVGLALFNLLPFPPLDGATVLSGLLPRDLARAYSKVEWLGSVVLVVLMVSGLTWVILGPPYVWMVRVLESVAGVPILHV